MLFRRVIFYFLPWDPESCYILSQLNGRYFEQLVKGPIYSFIKLPWCLGNQEKPFYEYVSFNDYHREEINVYITVKASFSFFLLKV